MYHLWWLYFPLLQLRRCNPFWSTIILITNNNDINGHKRNIYKNIKWQLFYDLTQRLCYKNNWSARIPKILKKSQNTAHRYMKIFHQISHTYSLIPYTLSLMYDKNIHDLITWYAQTLAIDIPNPCLKLNMSSCLSILT